MDGVTVLCIIYILTLIVYLSHWNVPIIYYMLLYTIYLITFFRLWKEHFVMFYWYSALPKATETLALTNTSLSRDRTDALGVQASVH